jgi:hypothetical protein
MLLAAPSLFPQAQTSSPKAAPSSQNASLANQPAASALLSNALLSNNDALALLRRISQLMESTMLAAPAWRVRRLTGRKRAAGAGQHRAGCPRTARFIHWPTCAFWRLPTRCPSNIRCRRRENRLRNCDAVDRMDADFQARWITKTSRGATDRDNLKRYAEDNARLDCSSKRRVSCFSATPAPMAGG